MDRYASENDYGRHEGDFHTHRSERYRHPEHDSNYRFENYGSSARGGYGNEGDWDTWGNQGDERGGARRNYTDINITDRDTYSTSRNYGNMGSYGGAQGFGDIRGGHHDASHPFDSGTGSSYSSSERDYHPRGYSSFGNESYDRGGKHGGDRYGYGSERYSRHDQGDLYGHDLPRRFQSSGRQDRYDFERDNYYSSDYGDDQGNYMGGGYHRETRSRYGEGDYGSSGYLQSDRGSDDRNLRSSREFNTAQNRWNTDW